MFMGGSGFASKPCPMFCTYTKRALQPKSSPFFIAPLTTPDFKIGPRRSPIVLTLQPYRVLEGISLSYQYATLEIINSDNGITF